MCIKSSKYFAVTEHLGNCGCATDGRLYKLTVLNIITNTGRCGVEKQEKI